MTQMYSSTRLKIVLGLTIPLFFLAAVSDAMAGRRGLRIDQIAWSEPIPIESCSGYTGSTSVFYGYTFIGDSLGLGDFRPYSYCQTANQYEEGLTTSEYLNSEIFEDDESGLASRIGSNTDGGSTATKYTYFNADGQGFQWAFYQLRSGDELVGYYSTFISQRPKIKSDPFTVLWDEPYYDGEYFCLGNGPDGFGVSEDGSQCYPYPPPTLSAAERDALVALYNSTDGENWTQNDNWLIGDPCYDNWYGVTCEGGDPFEAPTVVSLYLGQNNLNGTLPAGLDDLDNLQELYLDGNQISGPVPTELGNLYSMWWLDLRGNKLSGVIPDSLANLGEFGGIDLRWNGLNTPDIDLDGILDSIQLDGDWSITQTVPPDNLIVTAVGPTSIDLAWDAIEYTEDNGRYRVWYSTSPDGPVTDGGATASKLDTTFTITGLLIDVPYYVSVRTETDSHENNINDLESENSKIVSNSDHPNFLKMFYNGFE